MIKKVCFVLPTLGAGGAERILSFLAENFNKSKFEVNLLIVGMESDAVFSLYNTKIVFLNKRRVLNGVPALIRFLAKNKPNIVLSSIGHLNTVFGLLAPLFPKIKFVIREASVISIMSKYSKSNKLHEFLAQVAYKNIDVVVCQSNDMANDFKNIYCLPDRKIAVINNPITELFPIKKKNIDNSSIIKYITIGRLSKEKGHIRLLKILEQISHPFHYTIVGRGPEELQVMQDIEALGLKDKITIVPFTNKIGEVLSNHDLFLQGSYVEGFPNAVLESCVVGTPVIAFNVPGGTSEIIKDGINGYLVSNPDEFTMRLTSFERDDWNPQTIRDSVIDKFNKQTILKQYEDLLINL